MGEKMSCGDPRDAIPARDIERFFTRALEFSATARSLVLSLLALGFDVRRKADERFAPAPICG
jgi:hypothetical protein